MMKMSNKDQLTATTFAFVQELRDFSYGLSVSDHVWKILFPGKGDKWHHLRIIKYKHTFYINRVEGGGSLEVEEQQDAQLTNIRGAAAYYMGRIIETIRMFLAIHEADLPISIANPDGVRKRLLAQDNIGIIPA